MKCLNTYLFLIAFLLVCACQPKKQQSKLKETTPKVVEVDLKQIQERGKIVAATEANTTGYFIYKGQPMGFQYDMLKRMAKELGVELEIIVVSDIEKGIRLLQEGKCDVLALNLIVNKKRSKSISFTEHHTIARQVLVQRKPEGWKKKSEAAINKQLIRTQFGLIDKEVYVKKNSFNLTRLQHLSEEIGGEIHVHESAPEETTEDLVVKVAKGEIEYAIANENEAYVLAKYYGNIDVSTPIGLSQKISWGVRNNAPELLERTNVWLKKIKRTNEYYAIYDKYFKSSKAYRLRVSSPYLSFKNRLSPYDKLIKESAQKIGWDWRLLASLIYQESKFNPEAQSYAGAVGLMQLMPGTAVTFGANDFMAAEQSLRAGTKYLIYLDKFWRKKIPNKDERIKFILASYNVGQGHVLDAYKLTAKYEGNSAEWEGNVAKYLLHKSTPKYYSDPVVKLGYCRGKEPVKYVKEVYHRYAHYKNLIDG